MSAEPLQMDAGADRFEAAKDPASMLLAFRKHLQPHGTPAYEIRRCEISHVRRQGGRQRCVVQYTLHLAQPGTDRERSQQVTGVMYAGDRTRRIWKRVYASYPGPGAHCDAATFEPFSYVPELDMLVQVFPHDHRLQALAPLMRGPPPELEPLFLARFGFGDWRIEAWDAEPMRYLPELKATLRLTATAQDGTTGRADERRFYAKLYNHEEKAEQAYEVARTLRAKVGAGHEGFTAARPLAYEKDLRTVFQEEVRGASLQDMLLRGEDAAPAARRTAGALAALHLGDFGVPLPRLHLGDEVSILEKRGKALQRTCPHLGSRIEEVVGAVVAELEEVPLVPVHGDLNLGHVLLDGNRLALIDLDDFAEADPLLDVARVLASFAAVPHRFSLPHGPARAAARAFAEEYFSWAPEDRRAGLPARYAGALLKVAGGLFQKRVPGWPEKIEALVGEAEASLRGGIW